MLRHETRAADTTAPAAPLAGFTTCADQEAARSTGLAGSGAGDASFRLHWETAAVISAEAVERLILTVREQAVPQLVANCDLFKLAKCDRKRR